MTTIPKNFQSIYVTSLSNPSTSPNILTATTITSSNIVATTSTITNSIFTNITGGALTLNTGLSTGNIRLNNNTLYFRTAADTNHGLQWNTLGDGPRLWGNLGGTLAYGNTGTNTTMLWNSTGVGIFNDSPSYQLDVTGKSRVSSLDINGTQPSFNSSTLGSLFIGGGKGLLMGSTTGIYPEIHLGNYGHDNIPLMFDMYYDNTNFRISYGSTGNTGVGYSIYKQSGKLTFNYATGLEGDISSYTAAGAFGSSGNFGLGGQTIPNFPLDVSGTARITTSLTTGALYSTNLTSSNIVGTTSTIPNIVHTNVTTSTLLSTSFANLSFNSNTLGNLFTNAGNVGINTTGPNTLLEIRHNSQTNPLRVRNLFGTDAITGVELSLADNTVSTDAYSKSAIIFKQVNTSARGHLSLCVNTIDNSSNVSWADARLTIGTAGNVGIGTTAPSTKLDVVGNIKNGGFNFVSTSSMTSGSAGTVLIATNGAGLFSGRIWVDATSPSGGHSTTEFDITGTFTSDVAFAKPSILIKRAQYDTNNNVYNLIVCTSSVGQGYLSNYFLTCAASVTLKIKLLESVDTNLLTLTTPALTTLTATYAQTTYPLTNSGIMHCAHGNYLSVNNVGVAINSSNNAYTLDVNGNVGISGSSVSLNNGTSNTITFNTNGLGAPTQSVIGGAGCKLQLYPGSAGVNIPYGIGVENFNTWYASAGGGHKWYNVSTSAVMQLTAANLIVTGDISAFGTISDQRLKTNVQNISSISALETVKNMRPVTFDWKLDIFNKERRGTSDSGFIAQEIEELVPHAVGDYTEINSQEIYKNMRHERLIPYLTGAIQEQSKQIEALQKQINDLIK